VFICYGFSYKLNTYGRSSVGPSGYSPTYFISIRTERM